MKHMPKLVALVVLALGPAVALGAGPDDEDDDNGIPAVGRPEGLPFSGASGRFRVRARAEPTDLEAQTPLTFTLTVETTGPVKQPPQRIDLNQVPAFAGAFFIEDGVQREPGSGIWEFDYRLKPRRAAVKEVPGLPFVYYDPDLRPAARAFQVLYTDPIQLRVRPRSAVAVPLQAPAGAQRLEPAVDVLARAARWPTLGPAALAAIILLPPLGCLVWYWYWRRLNPDDARLAHRRRSRAARRALQHLAGLGRTPPERRAVLVPAAVTGYLHERLDLAAAEPTPAEAREHLVRRGCPEALAAQAADFYQAADKARFVPGTADGSDLPALAEQFILAVEAATCPWESS
jgi:hypothetical protein